MTDHAVVIAGAGPTGLMLAGELALAGVDCAVIERRPDQEIYGRRAGGLHARTIEVVDQRGIAERFLSQGKVMQVAGFAMVPLSISDFPTRHPYGVAMPQSDIERILAEWVHELGIRVRYSTEVVGFEQHEETVEVRLSGGETLRAQFLVGCDGGRSLIRKTAGIEFPGSDPTVSALIAEARLAEEPPQWGIRRTAAGINALSKIEDRGLVGVLVTEPQVEHAAEPTLRDLQDGLKAVYGTDYGVHDPAWITRFTDTTRQAATYRRGRVLLAGDAAHVHPPEGGQGLNLGVQDAVNLGWKLAQVVKRESPASLLDSYHTERHPVGARVLRNTMAQVVLRRDDARVNALREILGEVLVLDEPRKRVAAMQSGLDIRYDLGEGHPLLGRRMPDLDLVTPNGTKRVYTFLHNARAVLLNLGRSRLDVSTWADRVQMVDATYDGPWELPVIGAVTAPQAVLVRPDGYVAWVGDGTETGLVDALTRWFGPPRAAATS